MASNVEEIVRKVQAPKRWTAALEALAEAIGATDVEALEAAVRETLDEFLTGVPGRVTPEEIARNSRRM